MVSAEGHGRSRAAARGGGARAATARRRAQLLAAALLFGAAGCGATTSPGGGPPVAPPPRVAAINGAPGEMVRIEQHLVPGYVTIVDFWAEWCVACKALDGELASALAAEPLVVIRKADVGGGDNELTEAYRVAGLPHLRIFDRRGRLRYVLVGEDTHQAGAAALALAREP